VLDSAGRTESLANRLTHRPANHRSPRRLWGIWLCILENSQSKSREQGNRVRSHCSGSSVFVWSHPQDSQLAGLGAHRSRPVNLPSVPSDYVFFILAGS
jgi:hypothetical protein